MENVLGIAYHPYVTILGVTFWGTIDQTMKDSWERLTRKVKAQAKRAYTWGPCLATRMRYVNTFSCPKSGIPRKSSRLQTYKHNNWQPPLHGISGEEQSSECLYHHCNDQNKWEDGDAGYWGKVYGANPIPYLPVRPMEWNSDCSMVTDLEPHWQAGKPTACHKIPH